MATIKITMTELPNAGEGEAFTVAWPLLLNTNTGDPLELYGFTDRSVQVEGTFSGGTVTMQGSNDGTNYETIRDPSSTNLTFTVAGLKGVLEATRYMRPSVSGGDGATSVTVTMLCKRTKR